MWWGNGISPAQTPRMVKGSISICVVSVAASPSYKAIYEIDNYATREIESSNDNIASKELTSY